MIRVVLVEPEGEYNVGFVARLCKNFEVDELYIVNPKCDVNKAREFSSRGREVLDRAAIVNSYDEALEGVDIKISTSSIADVKGDILRKSIRPWELKDLIGDRRVALVFGRESVGLTREEIEKTDFLLHIPASEEYPVLNLSHAVGIVLYELWKTRDERKSNVSAETIRLIDKYSRILANIIGDYSRNSPMYLALKRSLVRGISDEEEGRTVVRLLRKLYTRIVYGNKDLEPKNDF